MSLSPEQRGTAALDRLPEERRLVLLRLRYWDGTTGGYKLIYTTFPFEPSTRSTPGIR